MAVRFDDGVDATGAASTTGMSADLFAILVCPVDKHDLRLRGTVLGCPECGRNYGIEDGIPNMLVEDSHRAPLD
jgi:uncharacterized protein YbaR (Trm112 family)